MGRRITRNDAGVLKNTTRAASQLAKDIVPVPFGLSTAARMKMDKDPNHLYSVSDYLGTILGGTPPTHETPKKVIQHRKELPWTMPFSSTARPGSQPQA